MIHILIVAKHAEVREGLCTVLQLSSQMIIMGAAGGLVDALEQASTTSPNVVIIDLEMPGGEGYEILSQLKSHFPQIKSLALTAHDYPSTWQRAAQAGASGMIVKGLDWQEMVATILRLALPHAPEGSET